MDRKIEYFLKFFYAFFQVAASLATPDPIMRVGWGGGCRPVSIFSREKNEIVYTRHISTEAQK